MLSHSFAVTGFSSLHESAPYTLFRLLTHFATPAFIAMFGAMLELAYLPKLRSGNGEAAVKRLITRALQCYLLYEVTVAALWLAGHGSAESSLRRVVLMGYMPLTGILRFYVIALVAAPLLLAIRRKFGLTPLLIFSVLAHLAHPIIQALPDVPEMPGRFYVFRVLDTLIGVGQQAQVPSLMHGLTLIIFGMAIGNATKNWMSGESARKHDGLRMFGVLAGMAGVPTLAMWSWAAPLDTVNELALGTLRAVHHPLYYSSGALGILLAVLLFTYLLDFRKLGFGKPIMFIGRTSLFTFSFGNSILFFAPSFASDAATAFIWSLGLFALVCFQSYAFYWLQSASSEPGMPSARIVRWAHALQARLAGGTAHAVSGIAIHYARALRLT